MGGITKDPSRNTFITKDLSRLDHPREDLIVGNRCGSSHLVQTSRDPCQFKTMHHSKSRPNRSYHDIGGVLLLVVATRGRLQQTSRDQCQLKKMCHSKSATNMGITIDLSRNVVIIQDLSHLDLMTRRPLYLTHHWIIVVVIPHDEKTPTSC